MIFLESENLLGLRSGRSDRGAHCSVGHHVVHEAREAADVRGEERCGEGEVRNQVPKAC